MMNNDPHLNTSAHALYNGCKSQMYSISLQGHVLLSERKRSEEVDGLLKKFVNSDFSRKLISAKKTAGVIRCPYATTRGCSGNHQEKCFLQSLIAFHPNVSSHGNR